jgi:predicted MFS family arabinose efflux permease
VEGPKIVPKQENRVAVGIGSIIGGLLIALFGAGTYWMYIGLFANVWGAVVIGAYLKDRNAS